MVKRLNAILVLLAVVLALGYLIARPHVGTVYWEWSIPDNLLEPPGHPGHQVERFSTLAECKKDAKDANDANLAADLAGSKVKHPYYACVPETALLWGW